MSGAANKKNVQKTCEYIDDSLPFNKRQFEDP